MHGNQWVLKIAVLKYYLVSKRGTTAKSNPKQATDPISLHTKFGDNSSNTFPLNERKPRVMPDIGRRTSEKAKIIYPPPHPPVFALIKNECETDCLPSLEKGETTVKKCETCLTSRYFEIFSSNLGLHKIFFI